MALPQPTLQATVTDSSIDFVGLVALCGLLLSSGFFSSRSLLPRRYSRELVCKAAYWPRYRSRRLVPYVVYTGCNCVPRDDLRYFRHRARFFLLVLVLERGTCLRVDYTHAFFLTRAFRPNAGQPRFPAIIYCHLISFVVIGQAHRDVIATRYSAFRYRDAIRSNTAANI